MAVGTGGIDFEKRKEKREKRKEKREEINTEGTEEEHPSATFRAGRGHRVEHSQEWLCHIWDGI
jgi:hypothetical protein